MPHLPRSLNYDIHGRPPAWAFGNGLLDDFINHIVIPRKKCCIPSMSQDVSQSGQITRHFRKRCVVAVASLRWQPLYQKSFARLMMLASASARAVRSNQLSQQHFPGGSMRPANSVYLAHRNLNHVRITTVNGRKDFSKSEVTGHRLVHPKVVCGRQFCRWSPG